MLTYGSSGHFIPVNKGVFLFLIRSYSNSVPLVDVLCYLFHSVSLFLFVPRVSPPLLSSHLLSSNAIPREEPSSDCNHQGGWLSMVFIFMGILLLNKMCASSVNTYLEKKISGDNL